MKTTVLFRLTMISACLLAFGACERSSPSKQAAHEVGANPSASSSPEDARAATTLRERGPVDLEIGKDAERIAVQRHWVGAATLNSHFGTGWADENVVHLTQVDQDTVLVWRGGRGWRVAHRDGGSFKTLTGHQVIRSATGWNYREGDKTASAMEFDTQGRLQTETPRVGAPRKYSYDPLGRLASVSAGPDKSIEYKYDANDRVSSVEGPNGARATYRYENNHLAEAVNSVSEKRGYSYDAGGATVEVLINGVARKAGGDTIAITASGASAIGNVARFSGIAALAIADVLAVAKSKEAIESGLEAANAASEEAAANAAGKAIRNALENKVAETLRNDPSKILPFASGRKPDPNKPQDVEQVLAQLHANASNNRKPFDGILVAPPDPQQEQVLKKARELLAEAKKLEDSAWSETRGEKSTIHQYLGARERLTAAALGLEVNEAALSGFNQIVEDVKVHTAGVQGAALRLQAAEEEMKSAIARCEAAATRACDGAGRSAQMNDAEADAAKSESSSMISQATALRQGSEQKLQVALEVSASSLRESLAGFLKLTAGYRASVSDARLAEANAAIMALKAHFVALKDAPARLNAARGPLYELRKQIEGVLAPVADNPEAKFLLGEATSLGSTLQPESTESENEHAAEDATQLKKLEEWADGYVPMLKRIANAVNGANVEALTAAATSALDQFAKASASAQAVAASARTNSALSRANDCLAQIKGGRGDAVAAGSVSPGTKSGDEVFVPDLSAMSPGEMEAALTHAGLKRALIAAKEKPPSNEKEFKFAGQSPAAGTKAKRGDVVAVSMYQKFEDAASDEVTVPDLSVYATTSEMEAVLTHAGLKRSLVAAKDKPPSKEKEFKFAGQSPAAGSTGKRGDVVAVSIYQKFEDAVAAADEVIVPDLSGYASTSEIEAVLTHAGLVRTLVAAKEKPPSKEKEFKFAGQLPGAGEKVKRGTAVAVAFYQKFESSDNAGNLVPNVIGLSLDQARSNLEAAGLQLGGLEHGATPPSGDKANLIYEQTPGVGEKLPANKMVSLKQYAASATKTAPVSPTGVDSIIAGGTDELIGKYVGTQSPGGGPVEVSIIRSNNGRFSMLVQIGPNSALGMGFGTTTVENGVIRWEGHGSRGYVWTVTGKVRGDIFVGEYTISCPSENINSRFALNATRKR